MITDPCWKDDLDLTCWWCGDILAEPTVQPDERDGRRVHDACAQEMRMPSALAQEER